MKVVYNLSSSILYDWRLSWLAIFISKAVITSELQILSFLIACLRSVPTGDVFCHSDELHCWKGSSSLHLLSYYRACAKPRLCS